MGSHYDIIIVGLGMSAAPLLEELIASRASRRILVLERGRRWDPRSPPEDLLNTSGRVTTVPPSEDFVVFTGKDGCDERLDKWWSADHAGGGSTLWYGQVARFRDSDFRMAERRKELGIPETAYSELHDWPFRLDAFSPFYDEIERRLRPLSSSYGLPPGTAHRGGVFLERPHVSHFERGLIDLLLAAGLHPGVGRTCLGGRAWTANPVDPFTLRPTGESPAYTSRNWYMRSLLNLAQARNVDVLWEAYATGLTGKRPEIEVEYRLPGDRTTYQATGQTVVLGGGTLETVRILLNSGLQDPHARVGRGLTFTTEAECYLATRLGRSNEAEDIACGSFASVAVTDFYDCPKGSRMKGGKISIYDAAHSDLPMDRARKMGLSPVKGAALAAAEQDFYTLKLSFKGESIPHAGKSVELSSQRNAFDQRVPHVLYSLHDHDHQVLDLALESFQTIARAIPGSEIISIHAPREGKQVVSAHQHGGAIFGLDPEHSLLDGNCQHWHVPGLYVVDGSFMPTSGATNSTLTLMANAIRVAAALTE